MRKSTNPNFYLYIIYTLSTHYLYIIHKSALNSAIDDFTILFFLTTFMLYLLVIHLLAFCLKAISATRIIFCRLIVLFQLFSVHSHRTRSNDGSADLHADSIRRSSLKEFYGSMTNCMGKQKSLLSG